MTSSWGHWAARLRSIIFFVAHCCETFFLPEFLHLMWTIHRETSLLEWVSAMKYFFATFMVWALVAFGCFELSVFLQSVLGGTIKVRTKQKHERWTFWNTIAVLASCTLRPHSKFWYDSRRQAAGLNIIPLTRRQFHLCYQWMCSLFKTSCKTASCGWRSRSRRENSRWISEVGYNASQLGRYIQAASYY